MKNNIDPYQFAFFRILTGIYLLFHFAFLYPYAGEMFGHTGMIPEAKTNPTFIIFPLNILAWIDSDGFVRGFLIFLMSLSALLISGFMRKWVCMLLLYGWIALFNRNNLTLVPGMGFVGWLLLAMIFIPKGEPLSLFPKPIKEWKMPVIVFAGAWLIMSVSYTLSGIDKLFSASWQDSTAVARLLNNPLMLENFFVDFLRSRSPFTLNMVSYFVLFSELLFFPLALFDKLKPIMWTLMVLTHISILLLMNLADLSLSMLLIHFFTFNPAWLKRKSPVTKTRTLQNV